MTKGTNIGKGEYLRVLIQSAYHKMVARNKSAWNYLKRLYIISMKVTKGRIMKETNN